MCEGGGGRGGGAGLVSDRLEITDLKNYPSF